MDKQYLAELEKELKVYPQPPLQGASPADIAAGVNRGREYRAIAVTLATRHAVRWLGSLFHASH